MRATRALLGAAGVLLVLVGLYHLLGTSLPDLVNVVLWLAGGVVVHDAVLAPLVVLLAVVVLPRLPSWSRAPAVAGFVVLLSVTLLAVPALGRFGARDDVPSLLDRPYGVLWLGFAALVLLVVVVASLWRRRRSTPVDPEAG
jgi:hypothetical protein